jgi:hypothetical protein
MPNLSAAREGIVAEIAELHARIGSLEKALVSLDELIGTQAEATPVAKTPGKRGRKPKLQTLAAPVKPAKAGKAKSAAKANVKASPKKAKAKADVEGELPFTGGDYWFDLVTSEPQTAPEILQKAIDGLGFTPTKQQRTKLLNRQTFALAAMVKTGRIKDSGMGREHRYFTT